jgi:hypothetical protein
MSPAKGVAAEGRKGWSGIALPGLLGNTQQTVTLLCEALSWWKHRSSFIRNEESLSAMNASAVHGFFIFMWICSQKFHIQIGKNRKNSEKRG